MRKKLATVILVLTLFFLFTITPAGAGDKQRYMWYGAEIALGPVALLGLLIHTHMAPPPPQYVVYSPPPEPYYYPPPEYVLGHWETTREWVPGTWKRVWVPSYYDRWGNWVAGHYEDCQTPGYYVERRVWVEERCPDY